MFVSDWMTKKVFTVTANDTIVDAIKMMQEKQIKHLPVVGDPGKVAGIMSDRDIKEYTPSKVSSFDVHELNYILYTTKVKSVMKKKVVVTTPGTPIEEAAMSMFDHQIGCLPVVENGTLAGIISDKDLFRVLIDITGVRHGGSRFYLMIPDRLGATKDVIDIVRDNGFIIDSVLTTYEGAKKGFKRVVVRSKGKEGDIRKAREVFTAKYSDNFFLL